MPYLTTHTKRTLRPTSHFSLLKISVLILTLSDSTPPIGISTACLRLSGSPLFVSRLRSAHLLISAAVLTPFLKRSQSFNETAVSSSILLFFSSYDYFFGASMILAALAMEAGLPDGVLNIVHGTNSNIGGKNYAIIMPDASIDDTLNALVAAGFGAAAGQRCMALCTAILVGRSMLCEDGLVELAKALKVNAGTDPSADIGPVISIEVRDRKSSLVQSAVESGARLLLDGRNIAVLGYEMGNFMGPVILHDVIPNMECFKVYTLPSNTIGFRLG